MVHSAHLQQLQAQLIRSASTSPFLSPQNSLQASAALLHTQAAAAAAAQAAAVAGLHNPGSYFPNLSTSTDATTSTALPITTGQVDLGTRVSESNHNSKDVKSTGITSSMTQIRSSSTDLPSSSSTSSSNRLNSLEPSSNVVSSTMEDDDSREGGLQLGSELGDPKKYLGTIKVCSISSTTNHYHSSIIRYYFHRIIFLLTIENTFIDLRYENSLSNI